MKRPVEQTEVAAWLVHVVWLMVVLLVAIPLRDTIPFGRWTILGALGAHLIALLTLVVPRLPARRGRELAFLADGILLLLVLHVAQGTLANVLVMLSLAPAFWLARHFEARYGFAALALLALLDLTLNRLPQGNEAIVSIGVWWLGVLVLFLVLAWHELLLGGIGQLSAAHNVDDEIGANAVTALTEQLPTLSGVGPIIEAGLQNAAKVLESAYGGTVRAIGFTFSPTDVNQLLVVATHKIEATWFGRRVQFASLQEAFNTGQIQVVQADIEVGREFPMLRQHWLLVVPLYMRLDVYGVMVFGLRKRPNIEEDRAITYVRALANLVSLSLHTQKMALELQRNREEILADEEDWRHKMARDLHDGPVQRVAAIAMQADFIMALLRNQPDRAPEELQQLRENALQTAQELRTLMFTLRPVVLETEGLVPALEQYVKRLREQDNLNITLYADPLPKMDDTLEQTVFAIVQEAVGNAKKHAQGAPITVRLERTARGLLVQVQDEGPGFDVEEVLGQYGRRTSLGMVNMRERAEIINGVLDIESAPGQGTTVSLFVPL